MQQGYKLGTQVTVRWKDGKSYKGEITWWPEKEKYRDGEVAVYFQEENNWATVLAENVIIVEKPNSGKKTRRLEETLFRVSVLWKKRLDIDRSPESEKVEVLTLLTYHMKDQGKAIIREILGEMQSPAITGAYAAAADIGDAAWLLGMLETIAEERTSGPEIRVKEVVKPRPKNKAVSSEEDESEESEEDESEESEEDESNQSKYDKKRKWLCLSDDSSEACETYRPPYLPQSISDGIERDGIVLSTPVNSYAQLDRARVAYTKIISNANINAKEQEELRVLYMKLLVPDKGTTTLKMDAIPQLLQRWIAEKKLVYSPDTNEKCRTYCFPTAFELIVNKQQGAELIVARVLWDMTDPLCGDISPPLWGLATSPDQTLTRVTIPTYDGKCQACNKLRCISVKLLTDADKCGAHEWLIGCNCAARIELALDVHRFGHRVCINRGKRASGPMSSEYSDEAILAEWESMSIRIQQCMKWQFN